MGVRESIERHRGWSAGIAAVGILAAAVFAFRATVPSPVAEARAAQSYYSVDDGATFFEAPADLVPPFEHQGKTAVRAAVFTCDGGKTRFVGYLERYPAAAKRQIEAAQQALKNGDRNAAPPAAAFAQVEVKKPGAGGTWVARSAGPAAAQILHVKPQPGSTGTPEPVTP
jgi:hypothetical protein